MEKLWQLRNEYDKNYFKNADLLEKAQILIDNKVVDTVTQEKTATIDIDERKTYFKIKNANGKRAPLEIIRENNTTELIYSKKDTLNAYISSKMYLFVLVTGDGLG